MKKESARSDDNKQDEAFLNSLTTSDAHDNGGGDQASSSSLAQHGGLATDWPVLPSYQEAASYPQQHHQSVENQEHAATGTRRPPQEQWHLFSRPAHAEPMLTERDVIRSEEMVSERVTNEGIVVTLDKRLSDRECCA